MKLKELKHSELLSIAIQIEERNFKIYRHLWLLLGEFNLEVSQRCRKLSEQKSFRKEKLKKEFYEHYSGVHSQVSLADVREDIEPLNIYDDYFDRFDPVHVLRLSLQIEKQAQCLDQVITKLIQESKIKKLCGFLAVSKGNVEKKIEDTWDRYRWRIAKLAEDQLPIFTDEQRFLILNFFRIIRGHCREPPPLLTARPRGSVIFDSSIFPKFNS